MPQLAKKSALPRDFLHQQNFTLQSLELSLNVNRKLFKQEFRCALRHLRSGYCRLS